MELDELGGAGITDRVEQARVTGLSLPQIDRIRRAAREGSAPVSTRPHLRQLSRGERSEPVQLGARVPSALLERVRDYGRRMGLSVALVTALALDDWLNRKGWPGSSGLEKNLADSLGL